MEWWRLVLEYLKVFLSAHVIIGAVALIFFKIFQDEIKELIKRIAKIRLPGGGELSTPQLEKLSSEKPIEDKTTPEPQSADLPINVAQENVEGLKALYNAERARAYFWEYSYLNYFLVPATQKTLDWIASCRAPLSLTLYDTLMTPSASDPKERKAILDALEKHHLIKIENSLITVNPKGYEYIEWRGKVLQSTFSNS